MKSDPRRDWLAAAGALAIGAATGRLLLDSMNDRDPAVSAALAAHADGEASEAKSGREPAAAHADGEASEAKSGREPAGAPGESGPGALPDRLVIVVLDGLDQGVFDEVVKGTSLAEPDWRATVDVGAPSLSRPVYHELLTGVPQDVSGIRNNAHSGRARADDLARRVRASGGTVGWALETVPWLHDLFGEPGDAYVRLGEEPRWNAITDRFDGPPRPWKDRFDAMAGVLRRSPRLAVLHFTGIDHAGHHRGARSPEYRAAAAEAIRTVKALRDSPLPEEPTPDLPRATPEKERAAGDRAVWMIGSDHGHLSGGGHGGPEPEVRRTTWIGLWPEPIPAGGSGRSLLPVTVPGVVPADRLAATFAAILRVPPPHHALGEPLPLPDRPSPPGPRWQERRDAVARALAESTRKAHQAVLVRVGIALAALVALIAWALRGGEWRDRALRLAGAATPVLGACLGFWALGPGLTLSAIRTHFAFMSQSLAATAIGAAIAAPLLARWRAPRAWLFVASAVPPLAACALTALSMGASRLPDGLLLLLPATGLVPWGVLLGTAAARALSAILGRGRAKTHPSEPREAPDSLPRPANDGDGDGDHGDGDHGDGDGDGLLRNRRNP